MRRTASRRSIFYSMVYPFDSVQSMLEFANGYSYMGIRLSGDKVDEDDFDSLRAWMIRLEREGYVEIQWTDLPEEGHRRIDAMALTTEGHKLLAELRSQSAGAKLKQRIADLAWIVVVSMLTTLATIQVRGWLAPAPAPTAQPQQVTAAEGESNE
ncbi:hypothetical protein [Aeoliella sp.]|uniref:hypothetical protein n=1 Tax=Aeoliella sp. TaxID=2795800 RepID=UPI003CCBB904